eukprot:TRINITY_DN1469_c0_g1_i3.p1 TRINITY_DN1469_c0_g1~~TRINITY_DN1469_c0_g1_i3.p1  ORF type:complete len:164 (+),score=48.50 TRINITY_DN1469_c0_g1_i3:156-647(+)
MGSSASKDKLLGDINRLQDRVAKRKSFCSTGATRHLKDANVHLRKAEYEGNSHRTLECAKCFKDGRLLFNEDNFLKDLLATLQEVKDEGFGKHEEKRDEELETLKKVEEAMNLYMMIGKKPEGQVEIIKEYESRQPIGPVSSAMSGRTPSQLKGMCRKCLKST